MKYCTCISQRSAGRHGFSMIEILIVVSIMAGLALLFGLSLRTLLNASNTNTAVSQLEGTIEMARSYALANNTYVRVGFQQITINSTVYTAVISIYSADGGRSAAMNGTNWPMLAKPVYLKNLTSNNALNGGTPNTSSDANPFISSSAFGSYQLKFPEIAATVSVNQLMEFTPTGEVRLDATTTLRYVKIPLSEASGPVLNPFIIRISGINGSLTTIRKADIL